MAAWAGLRMLWSGLSRITESIPYNQGLVPHTAESIPDNQGLVPHTAEVWVTCWRPCGLFYSTYLDLDMMMIKAFPAAYKLSTPFDPTLDDEEKK